MGKIVFFDLETGGLDPSKHPVTQFAAIAVNNKWKEIETLEMKVLFDEATAEKEALDHNHYDPAVWKAEGVHQDQALTKISSFLKRHATFKQISQRGKPYFCAQLAGHNVSKFDIEFLLAFYRYGQPGEGPAAKTDIERADRGSLEKRGGPWCPIRFMTLDTLTIATFWEFMLNPKIDNLRLGTLAEFFGYDLGENAHDALEDVRANVVVGKHLFFEMWKGLSFSEYLDPKRRK